MTKIIFPLLVAIVCLYLGFAVDHYFRGEWYAIPTGWILGGAITIHVLLAVLKAIELIKDKGAKDED